jgi:uncharacterized membrane protein YjjP (DUF1212 family)
MLPRTEYQRCEAADVPEAVNPRNNMSITPNKGGLQPESTPPPSSPRPIVVLIMAGACGTLSGYLGNDWRIGAEVFAAIVALYVHGPR